MEIHQSTKANEGRVILLIQNALYVPSLDHNLLPPFMMREAGVIVKDNPKIQLDDPSEEDHALTLSKTDFRILLSLSLIIVLNNQSL
jgi:hypothetical protein